MAGMSMSYPTEAHRLRDNKVRELQADVRTKQAAVDDQKTKMCRYFFKYAPPEPDFDSRRVKGTIGSLIDNYDPRLTTALEVAAGDQIYSVVVDSQETSMLLMKTGNLPRNTNFIPLNQIKAEVIHRELVAAAQEIGGGPGNVQLALDMIIYDIEYEPAMKFVFGNTLICKTMQMAIKVAFHPGLYYRVVTYDGDVVNPNGSLTGGVAPEGGALTQRDKLGKLQVELENAEKDLSDFMKYQYSLIASD